MHLPVSRVVVLGFGTCNQTVLIVTNEWYRVMIPRSMTRTNHQPTVTLLTWKRQEWIWNYCSNSSVIWLSEHLLLKVIITFLDGKKFQQVLGNLCIPLSLVTNIAAIFLVHVFKNIVKHSSRSSRNWDSTSIQYVLLLVELCTDNYITKFQTVSCSSTFESMFCYCMLVRICVLLLNWRFDSSSCSGMFDPMSCYVRSQCPATTGSSLCPAAVSSKFGYVPCCGSKKFLSYYCSFALGPAIVHCRFASLTCYSSM